MRIVFEGLRWNATTHMRRPPFAGVSEDCSRAISS
jgi:hypothetical protein